MSVLLALIILVVGVVIAFWIVDRIKSGAPETPSIVWTIAYLAIGLLALIILWSILTTGTASIPPALR